MPHHGSRIVCVSKREGEICELIDEELRILALVGGCKRCAILRGIMFYSGLILTYIVKG